MTINALMVQVAWDKVLDCCNIICLSVWQLLLLLCSVVDSSVRIIDWLSLTSPMRVDGIRCYSTKPSHVRIFYNHEKMLWENP